ncbi:membrane protein [Citricoccus zhacaiensis]|uniref:Membrane protein n=1 Tax=Citricoccus zhacaiensis TaxID=489142 RepID=A0ABQ2M9S6_9MICC|nr:hypothetical protein [Citricoccus zhacaiensis]GGO48580.1 membrane protein [Citricoccus zhacaiensis]
MTPPIVMATALAGMGVLHFARPRAFDGLIPRALPGSARPWTYGSGVAELAVAGLLAVPATRRAGGRGAQVLFLAVWPGNFYHAWRARKATPGIRAVTLARLPLQIPMIRAAGRIASGR